MSDSSESREPFLESTKHLHSPSAVQLYDQRIAGGRDLGVSKDLDDIRTQSGLEIHVSLHGNGTVLLGHPTAADFEAGKVVSDDAMTPADFLRAIEQLKGFSSITLDHRPLNGQIHERRNFRRHPLRQTRNFRIGFTITKCLW